jgi:large subunit ribosomal protein L25
MTHLELQAKLRTETGNKARKLRRDGVIPAVIFSKSYGSENVQVNFSEFYKVYKQSGKNHVIDLMVDDKKIPVIVNEIDVHPYKGLPRHVNFLAVDLKTKVTASVPVEIEGESPGVKEFGAVLIVDMEDIEVSALPDKLPNSIVINIEKLKEVGDSIKISDLTAGGDYDFVVDADQSVVTLVAQSKEEDFETQVEVVEETETTEITESAKE